MSNLMKLLTRSLLAGVLILLIASLACNGDTSQPAADSEISSAEECEQEPEPAEAEIDESFDSSPETDANADAEERETTDTELDKLVVAIFDDTANDDASAWPEGLDLIERACELGNLAHVRISRQQLNSGIELGQFSAIVFGGGFAYPGYTQRITEDAKERIRQYVAAGGGFVGICAGAYFACEHVHYEGQDFGAEEGYDLSLFPGTCTGPIEAISTYPNWNTALVRFGESDIFGTVCANGCNMYFWYAGGPWFLPNQQTNTQTLGVYMDESARNAPAVILHEYGNGNVILWGVHPEATWYGSSAQTPYMLADALRWLAKKRK